MIFGLACVILLYHEAGSRRRPQLVPGAVARSQADVQHHSPRGKTMSALVRRRLVQGSFGVILLAILSPLFADNPDDAAPPKEPKDTKILTRGPIHEAFAQPSAKDPEAAPVIDKKPPDPIKEEVPDTKPDNDDALWIPGYWAWDEENEDFLWVS